MRKLLIAILLLSIPITNIYAYDPYADQIQVDITNLDGNFSASEDDVQKVIEKADEFTLDTMADRGAVTDQAITTGGLTIAPGQKVYLDASQNTYVTSTGTVIGFYVNNILQMEIQAGKVVMK